MQFAQVDVACIYIVTVCLNQLWQYKRLSDHSLVSKMLLGLTTSFSKKTDLWMDERAIWRLGVVVVCHLFHFNCYLRQELSSGIVVRGKK